LAGKQAVANEAELLQTPNQDNERIFEGITRQGKVIEEEAS